VCGGDALNLFQPEELELLICGDPGSLDVEAWSRSCQYEEPLRPDHPLVQQFWAVVREFSEGQSRRSGLAHTHTHTHGKRQPPDVSPLATAEEKRLLLRFWSGSARAPIGGIASTTWVLGKNGDDEDGSGRLPTAHTCELARHKSVRSSCEELALMAPVCVCVSLHAYRLPAPAPALL
jgi:ubiquitin-protein ligase E3 A